MTGANRILVGVGWVLVVLIAWRRSKERGNPVGARGMRVPLAFLTIALAVLPAAAVQAHPHPVGYGRARRRVRRLQLAGVAGAGRRAGAGRPVGVGRRHVEGAAGGRRSSGCSWCRPGVIVLAAEPFRRGARRHRLAARHQPVPARAVGRAARLGGAGAARPPGLYAWRLHTTEALGALVSSKVNQWTLLVGTLPVVFAVSSRGWSGLPIEPAQRGELLLTARAVAAAIALLLGLTLMPALPRCVLGGLFLRAVPAQRGGAGLLARSRAGRPVRVYLLLALVALVRKRRALLPMLRDGLLTPYAELGTDLRCNHDGRRPPPAALAPAVPVVPDARPALSAYHCAASWLCWLASRKGSLPCSRRTAPCPGHRAGAAYPTRAAGARADGGGPLQRGDLCRSSRKQHQRVFFSSGTRRGIPAATASNRFLGFLRSEFRHGRLLTDHQLQFGNQVDHQLAIGTSALRIAFRQ